MNPDAAFYALMLAGFAWGLWQIVTAIQDSARWFKSHSLPAPNVEDRIS